ncbi:hypothetical protein ACFLUF_00845 [Chloroflexota bacterium]
MSTQTGQLTEEQKSKLGHLKPEQIEKLHQNPNVFSWAKVMASRDIPIGHELEPRVFHATQDKLRIYFGGPNKASRHTDFPAAWHTGIPRVVVMVNHIAEYMGAMLVRFFGEGYIGGHLDWLAIRVPIEDDTFTIHMVVKDKVEEGKRMRILLDMWVDNQHGDKAIVGSASGMVD